MTRTQIVKALKKSGYESEYTCTGFTMNGANIVHSDKTGLTMYKGNKFRPTDLRDFLRNLNNLMP
jgi:hypothetical protein